LELVVPEFEAVLLSLAPDVVCPPLLAVVPPVEPVVSELLLVVCPPLLEVVDVLAPPVSPPAELVVPPSL